MSSQTASVENLIARADQATVAGQHAEAAALLAHAQSAFPQHPLVLSALGMRALRNADAPAAKEFLQHAVAADPHAPALWLNLALACRATKDEHGELAALQKALAIDPYFSLALLQKARLMERRGERKQAAQCFHAFLASVPPGAERNAALSSAIEHARKIVRQANDELFEFIQTKVAEVRARHQEAPQERFAASIDMLVGRKRHYVPQPTFMLFPHLPAIQFYAAAEFPWLSAIEAATAEIRQEVFAILRDDHAALEPYVQHPDGSPLNQWRELNQSPRWSAYYLWREGRPIDDHLARCPATAAALARAPMPRIGGHAPTAFFSILQPRTHIPPHTGVTNTRLVVHLPLRVPAGCGFRVGYDVREWREGSALVFDDSIEHEAWNRSDELRAVLIFDVWNPYLSAAERDLVAAATEAVAEYQGTSGVVER